VTLVVCPVGLRIVIPGYVPPYVHIFVHGPSKICTHASSIPIDTFGSVATGGNNNGCVKGVGEAVGVGVIVGVAVAVGVGVGVIGGVGVGVDVAVGEAVGVGVGVDAVYWIVSTGELALSRESNRFAVVLVDSSPSTNQPKLMAGLSSHDCTSVIICVELQI
jgi:hypothetical protein